MLSRLEIRQQTEKREENLSRGAVKSRQSRGRQIEEEACPIRTVFQRDRDRIIHSKAFRRLKHKTQVFIAPQGDHYVTRLTHTLEVSQIARTIARALNLNEDLTEAIALGHDLGHTPFGHMGEDVLNELYEDGFRHNEQSLRVVDILENDGRGLNLTYEVRDGILCHSKPRDGILANWERLETREGEIVRLSDIIAYINHDIGDAIRAGIIKDRDLPASALRVLGNSHRDRINTLVSDIICSSWVKEDEQRKTVAITMSREVIEATDNLRDFLFAKVYNRLSTEEDTGRAREIVRRLYQYFSDHKTELPREYSLHTSGVGRRMVDYIGGMTDHYATGLAEDLGLMG